MEKEGDGGHEHFWDFVFKTRYAVDDDIEDLLDEYVSKGMKRVFKLEEVC